AAAGLLRGSAGRRNAVARTYAARRQSRNGPAGRTLRLRGERAPSSRTPSYAPLSCIHIARHCSAPAPAAARRADHPPRSRPAVTRRASPAPLADAAAEVGRPVVMERAIGVVGQADANLIEVGAQHVGVVARRVAPGLEDALGRVVAGRNVLA